MSVYIGNYVPGFNFRLNSQPTNSKIFSSASSGISSGHIIDCSTIVSSYSGAITGTQYFITIVPQRSVQFGQNPIVNLTVDNSGIASIDQIGNVSFVNSGNFNVIGNYSFNSFYQGSNVILPLTNYKGSGASYTGFSFSPDPVNISNHVLVIYNTNSNDSINLKTYYTGHRPLFSQANVLGISCPSGQEIISYSGFTNLIRQPIVNYLTGVSGSKSIRYGIFMLDIPTRVGDTNTSSVSYQLYNAYQQLNLRNGTDYNQQPYHFSLGQFQQNTILTSYINFGSYQDCTSYIDKISANQTGIYLTGNSQNTGYYIEDAGGYISATQYFYFRNFLPLSGQFPNGSYVYEANAQPHITTGNNLAGYCSWGSDGGLGEYYANNGLIKWNDSKNNWYILLTVDSFNGQRNSNQGNFINWFSGGAFGSSGYNNCPVGAVGNVEEPYLYSSCVSGYFNLWQLEYPFIECAWQSRMTPYFAVFGDPLIIK